MKAINDLHEALVRRREARARRRIRASIGARLARDIGLVDVDMPDRMFRL
jgi:hypothetical protein